MDASQLDWLTGFETAAHEPPCPPDSRCTICYSVDEIADAESFDATFDPPRAEPVPVYLDDSERYGELPERIDPQTGFLAEREPGEYWR